MRHGFILHAWSVRKLFWTAQILQLATVSRRQLVQDREVHPEVKVILPVLLKVHRAVALFFLGRANSASLTFGRVLACWGLLWLWHLISASLVCCQPPKMSPNQHVIHIVVRVPNPVNKSECPGQDRQILLVSWRGREYSLPSAHMSGLSQDCSYLLLPSPHQVPLTQCHSH